MASSQKISLSITSLAHDGRGIAFLTNDNGRGKAVFVAGALPGQKAFCRIIREKKNFAEAELVDILEDLPGRQQALCPHQAHCGGCPLQPLAYASQLQWKENLAMEALARIGGLPAHIVDPVWERPIPSPHLRSYRNKIEFAFGGPDLVLGMRQRNSHAVFSLENCALVDDAANQIARACADMARHKDLPAYMPGKGGFWRFLILRKGFPPESDAPAWYAICLTSPGNRRQRASVRRLGEQLMAAQPGLAAFIHEERSRRDGAAIGEKRVLSLGRTADQPVEMRMRLLGKEFSLDPVSFFQVNDGGARELALLAASMTPDSGEGMLDLYSGVGAPGLLLAHRFSHVVGVECDRRAVAFANANAQAFNLSHAAYQLGDTAAFLEKISSSPGRWTTVLADPPRAGLDARAIAAIQNLRPHNIVYISCNPATLARDAAILDKTHELARFASVDLFPHTPHLECCALWRARG